MHWLFPFFYLEAKFGPVEKRMKTIDIEMEFYRRTAGYDLLDRKRNEEILEELKVEQFDEKLRRYKSNWLRHKKKSNKTRCKKYC
jgi:hypothetical protein